MSGAREFVAGAARRPGAVVAGALALGLLVGVLVGPGSDAATAPAGQTRVVGSTTFVCSDVTRPAAGSTTVVVAAPRVGGTGQGRAQVRRLAPRATPALATLTRPGQAAVLGARSPGGAWTGTGTGALAPGLSAARMTVQPAGLGRGLAGGDCEDVGSVAWFVGPSTVSGQAARLFLSNPAASVARVDIAVYGPKGPVDLPSTQGIVVPARGTRTLAVEALAPGLSSVALQVVTTSGRIVAALRTASRFGAVPRGTDFVPAAAEPATRAVVPAVPAGSGPRLLVVANPGNDDADVRLTVAGRAESFAPVGVDRFTVPAGATRAVPVAGALDGEGAGLVLESTAPVAAAVRASAGVPPRGRAAEYGWTSSVPPVTGWAVEPWVRRDAAYDARLALTAPDGPAQVEIFGGRPGGAETRRVVRIPAGTTQLVVPPGPTGGQLVVRLRPLPGSGPVWAGRIQVRSAAGGFLLTIAPMRDARISVESLAAVPQPAAVLR